MCSDHTSHSFLLSFSFLLGVLSSNQPLADALVPRVGMGGLHGEIQGLLLAPPGH